MIVLSTCTTCFQPYKLLIQASDVGLVKEISTKEGKACPCPRRCGGEINLVGEAAGIPENTNLREPIEITGLQLYQAVGGLGLPDEMPKDKEIVTSLLKGNKVSQVIVDEANGSLFLHSIGLDNGVTIHLTSGARGARVLKITKESPNGSVDHR